MNFEQALKVLKTRPIRAKGFDWLKFAKVHKDRVTRAEFCDSWKTKWYPEGPDIDKESTYDDCVLVDIREKDGKIFLTMQIWSGDTLHGRRVSQETEYDLTFDFLPEPIAAKCEHALRDIAETIIEKEDWNERERRIASAMTAFIADH